MTTTIRIATLAALWCALLVGTPCRAQTAANAPTQIDSASWGIYTRLAGTTRQDSGGYTMTWHWQEPGRVLIEEYRMPGASKASQTGSITPGPTPGTLVLNASTVLGKKLWNGTVQPDGSVVYLGTGMLKMNYKAVLADDGAYEIRRIKVQNGKVVSVADANPALTYRLSASDAPAAVVAVAQATPEPRTAAVAPTVAAVQALPALAPNAPAATPGPAAAAASKLPTKPDNLAKASTAPSAASKGHDPVAEHRRAARDYLERLFKGPTGKAGVWVDTESGDVMRFTKSATTYTRVLTRLDEHGSYKSPSVATFEVEETDGSAAMRTDDVLVRYNIERSASGTFTVSYFKEPLEAGSAGSFDARFSGDEYVFTDSHGSQRSVWRSEADALAVQSSLAKLRAAQTEAKRTQERIASIQAEARQREMEEDIRRREAEEAEQQAQYEQLEGEREVAHAQWEEESRRSSQELEDSLQRLRDSTAEYEAVAKRLSGAQAPASTGNARAGSNPAGARATSERVAASLGTGSDASSARQGTATGANSESARPGQPLKFKLQVGLEPKPGDTVNPSCVSTLITRGSPGPGWGSSEFHGNDASNYAKAQAEVERVKRQFFIACGASGYTVREGDFLWEWNQTSSDLLDRMGAHSREDITVNVP